MVQAFTSSNIYSAEGSKQTLLQNAQENIEWLNLSKQVKDIKYKSITSMSLNYLALAERHKQTRPYSSARAEQGANH